MSLPPGSNNICGGLVFHTQWLYTERVGPIHGIWSTPGAQSYIFRMALVTNLDGGISTVLADVAMADLEVLDGLGTTMASGYSPHTLLLWWNRVIQSYHYIHDSTKTISDTMSYKIGIAPTLLVGRVAAGQARPNDSWGSSATSSLRFGENSLGHTQDSMDEEAVGDERRCIIDGDVVIDASSYERQHVSDEEGARGCFRGKGDPNEEVIIGVADKQSQRS
ncbi:hypothetical protein IW261DRAFT_1612244 [Armillaria novae-zelandiae]|uniref:Uncharacterized protein n=1 Tax=Armillaria novae-zelandiae TaxID=153914 RepID=A0AA39UA32_9AGAR|nr:hypothetical protein IW261DRAFT_1612244 [Armillaria novae-zelandiae]